MCEKINQVYQPVNAQVKLYNKHAYFQSSFLLFVKSFNLHVSHLY